MQTKIAQYNINRIQVKWIKNWLHSRTQKVVVSECVSRQMLQALVLRRMFNIFINDGKLNILVTKLVAY